MLRHKVDINAFQRVILVHNHNSGKQNFFNGIHNNVESIARQLMRLYGSERFQYVTVGTFAETQAVGKKICAEKIQWVIVAGGDGTLRALVEECVDQDYWPYVSIYPAGTVNLVAKELMQKTDVHNWMYRVSKGVTTPVCLGRANDRSSRDRGGFHGGAAGDPQREEIPFYFGLCAPERTGAGE